MSGHHPHPSLAMPPFSFVLQAASDGGHEDAVQNACFYEYRAHTNPWRYGAVSYRNRGKKMPRVVLCTYRMQNHVQVFEDEMHYSRIHPWGPYKSYFSGQELKDRRGKWKAIGLVRIPPPEVRVAAPICKEPL